MKLYIAVADDFQLHGPSMQQAFDAITEFRLWSVMNTNPSKSEISAYHFRQHHLLSTDRKFKNGLARAIYSIEIFV